MTQNTETQTGQQNQAEFNKSQQAGGGEPKQGQQDQTLSQSKEQDAQKLAGQEDKSFQTESQQGQATQQYAQGGQDQTTDQQKIQGGGKIDADEKTSGV